MILLELYWRFFQVGLFSFGGGYAALPLIKQQIVEITGWLTQTEFSDIVAISQMTPGPIALNASTFVGVKIAGLIGGVVATLGCITPSCIIVLILARYFFKYRDLRFMQSILRGLRPAVAALIMTASVSIVATAVFLVVPAGFRLPAPADIDWVAVGIFSIALFLLRKYKIKLLPIMAGAGAVGVLLYGYML